MDKTAVCGTADPSSILSGRTNAEIANQLDFSKKPYLRKGLEGVVKKINRLAEDEERLLLEYAQ